MRILCEGAFQIDPGVGKTLDPGVKRRDDGRREVCRARGRMTEGGAAGMTGEKTDDG